jgi:hypothetical protein
MSTRNLPGGKGRPAREADNITTMCKRSRAALKWLEILFFLQLKQHEDDDNEQLPYIEHFDRLLYMQTISADDGVLHLTWRHWLQKEFL